RCSAGACWNGVARWWARGRRERALSRGFGRLLGSLLGSVGGHVLADLGGNLGPFIWCQVDRRMGRAAFAGAPFGVCVERARSPQIAFLGQLVGGVPHLAVQLGAAGL